MAGDLSAMLSVEMLFFFRLLRFSVLTSGTRRSCCAANDLVAGFAAPRALRIVIFWLTAKAAGYQPTGAGYYNPSDGIA